MFIKKNTRRALLVSVMSLILCCAMLMGTTFAWFTDSVTSGNNIIKSGNLDVEMYWADGTKAVPAKDSTEWTQVGSNTDQPIFSYTLWEPGYTQVRHLKIVNKGNLALNYQVKIVANGAVSNLSDAIDVYYSDPAVQISSRTDLTADMKLGTLTQALAAMSQTASGSLLAGAETTLTLALKMQELAGNEYQNKSIGSDFSIILYATQKNYEEDSFGSDYDGTVAQPVAVSGSVAAESSNVENGEYTIHLLRSNGSKSGSAVVPVDAVADDAEAVSANVVQTVRNTAVVVEEDEAATTFNINVTGLKEGNTEKITVTFYAEPGLSGVRIFHNETEMNKADYTYNPVDGKVIVKSASFSPFTLVYEKNAEYVAPEAKPEGLPKAIVTPQPQYVAGGEKANITWGEYGQWSPTKGLSSTLEAAYLFQCAETPVQAANNAYANWYCDFYVKLDRDLGQNQIFLGGEYGTWGWIGFHNGEVTLSANEELPLLGSVTNSPWTYADIASFVNEFTCGVGHVGDALDGATFTVMLRLTNPEDATDFHNVATINYTFE